MLGLRDVGIRALNLLSNGKLERLRNMKTKTVKEILEYINERFEEVGKIKPDDTKDLWGQVAILDELENLRAMIEE